MELEKEIKGALKHIHQWAIDCRNLQPGFSCKYKSDQDRVKCLKLLIHIYQQAEAAMFALDYVRCYKKDDPALHDWMCNRCHAEQKRNGDVWYDKKTGKYLCKKCAEELNKDEYENVKESKLSSKRSSRKGKKKKRS